ncbi:DUF3515 family protein [Canibacter oris]|uniref:Putative small lipoprotein YifL n=1 Tax=Canibacter oris TaxID=1365628 RepID=A0A840DED9_9MICO|nr:putative small lipoprotein YifL [Canibacter oris]
MLKKVFAVVGIPTLAITLTACAAEVPLDAAPDANNPDCAQVTVRLPDTVTTHAKRATNAQATGAWGDPAVVILRCGLPISTPTTDPCITVNGIDWVVDDSAAPRYRFEAYGRSPGLEVFVDSEQISGTDALLELSPAVQQLPQVRQCLTSSTSLDSTDIQLDN